MDNAKCERAHGDDVDPNDGMLGIQGADKKLFPIETSKEGAEGVCCTGRIVNCDWWSFMAALRHDAHSVPGNKRRSCQQTEHCSFFFVLHHTLLQVKNFSRTPHK